METFTNNDNLRVTSGMENNWRITSKWAMFFAVLGFIGAGLYLLGAVAIVPVFRMMIAMGNLPPSVSMLLGSMSWLFVLIYLLAVAAMFFLSFFHLKFSNGINRAINFTDQNSFAIAWRNLRNHFRLYGIIIIVSFVLYIVLIAVAVSIGTSAVDQLNY